MLGKHCDVMTLIMKYDKYPKFCLFIVLFIVKI